MKLISPRSAIEQQHQSLRHWPWLSLAFYLGGLLLALGAILAFPWRQPAVAVAAVNSVADKASVNLEVAPGCLNLIKGGNFEQFNPSWQIVAGTRPPMYTSEQTFNNSLQSMRIGNGLELPNIESVSEVRHESVLLPYGATRILLRFLYYPLYDAAPGGDLQQADLFDATTEQLIVSLLNTQDNARTWKAREFDLTAYAGRAISLRFRVRNDGEGGRTLMYIDNVELEYCAQAPLATFTPTLPPTPTGTPLPTSTLAPTTSTLTPTSTLTSIPTVSPLPTTPVAVTVTPIVVTSVPLPPEDLTCPNLLVNGNFEGFDGWHFGEDPVPARYVYNFFQEGTRSVLLGNPPENPTNVVTFSSIRQLVTIPFTMGQVQLRWWRLPYTAQPGTPTSTTDRQDVILLAPNLKPIQILRRELRNDGIWQEDAVDLTAYRGQTLYIYFNVFNDANNARTWMYLDNVRLRVCGAPVAAPTIMVTPIAIPLTPNLTYTILPTLTLSSFPTLIETATLPPLPSPTSTETVVAAFVQPDLPAATPTIPNTPTSNVYPLPTLPTQTVVDSSTPLTVAPTFNTLEQPLVVTPVQVVSQRPLWVDRLGAVAVLAGILVVIGFIVMAIVRMFQRQP